MKLTSWDECVLLSSSLCLVQKARVWGIMNASEEVLVPLKYRSIHPLTHLVHVHRFLVQEQDSLRYYIVDEKNTVWLELGWEVVSATYMCHEASVCCRTKEGYRKSYQITATQCILLEDGPWDLYTVIQDRHLYGLFSRLQGQIIACVWKHLSFYGTYCIVSNQQNEQFIIQLFPYTQIRLGAFRLGGVGGEENQYIYIYDAENKAGVMDSMGNVLFPCHYRSIEYVEDGIFSCSYPDQTFVWITAQGQEIRRTNANTRYVGWDTFLVPISFYVFELLTRKGQSKAVISLAHLKDSLPSETTAMCIRVNGYWVHYPHREAEYKEYWLVGCYIPDSQYGTRCLYGLLDTDCSLRIMPEWDEIEVTPNVIVLYKYTDSPRIIWVDRETLEILSDTVFNPPTYKELNHKHIRSTTHQYRDIFSISMDAFFTLPLAIYDQTACFRVLTPFIMALVNKRGEVIEWHWRTLVLAGEHTVVARFYRHTYRFSAYLYKPTTHKLEQLPYRHLSYHTEAFLILKKNQAFHILSGNLAKAYAISFQSYRVYPDCIQFRNDLYTEIWTLDGEQKLTSENTWRFVRWNDCVIYQPAGNYKVGIINFQKEWRLALLYDDIRVLNEWYCCVKKDKYWQIFSYENWDFVKIGQIKKWKLEKKPGRKRRKNILKLRNSYDQWQSFQIEENLLLPVPNVI